MTESYPEYGGVRECVQAQVGILDAINVLMRKLTSSYYRLLGSLLFARYSCTDFNCKRCHYNAAKWRRHVDECTSFDEVKERIEELDYWCGEGSLLLDNDVPKLLAR